MAYYTRSISATILAFITGAATWAIWGDRIKKRLGESRAWAELKREVREESMKARDLTREKYEEIVDRVSDKYAKAKGISQNELGDLVDDLKMHWNKIKEAWRGGENK